MPSCHLFRWRPSPVHPIASTRVLILGAVFLAFAIMTIEYAVLLCLTYVICLYVDGRQNGYPLKSLCIDLLKVCGVVIFVIICLWPAGIFKLSLVKITFFAYFAIERGGWCRMQKWVISGQIALWHHRWSPWCY